MSVADSSTSAADIALRLPNTLAGQAWLDQFDAEDRELAIRLLSTLTLVSQTAFERALQTLILAEATEIDGPVALYATRELAPDADYFKDMANPVDPMAALDAVGGGADLGSEARIAAIIRNLCKTAPKKLLNHPSLEMLRAARVRAIFTIDDIIGSGKRTASFLQAMWQSPSVMSWHSRDHIRFAALAYSATRIGERRVRALNSKPQVIVVRDCPTFDALPWHDDIGEAIRELCNRYGRRTSRPGMRLGFQKTIAALVFEHGCPNNTPSILWAPVSDKSEWKPLFPDRTVLPETASAFPPDIMARDPIALLSDLTGDETEIPPAILGEAPLGNITATVLALAAAGVRSRAALSYATGYDIRACAGLIDRCVARGYLTATLRLTAAGRAELKETGWPEEPDRVPPRGEDGYYPHQLRGPS
ncbi:MAG: hypothetical protein DI636_03400 [Pelagerythrobacter marensis]|nr:MAG: hypothetical protein DI636_03400 [Pelagerythrobacter marensis]